MGIRCYAYPITERQVPFVRIDPDAFLGEDPLYDAWGPAEDRPRMLYLDTCWSSLQCLFALRGTDARPAAALVAGDVIPTSEGRIGHRAVLAPDEVSNIAADLERFDPDEQMLADAHRYRDRADCVRQYRQSAREFLCSLRDDGLGLVHLIG